jgi:hypothetical protein
MNPVRRKLRVYWNEAEIERRSWGRKFLDFHTPPLPNSSLPLDLRLDSSLDLQGGFVVGGQFQLVLSPLSGRGRPWPPREAVKVARAPSFPSTVTTIFDSLYGLCPLSRPVPQW